MKRLYYKHAENRQLLGRRENEHWNNVHRNGKKVPKREAQAPSPYANAHHGTNKETGQQKDKIAHRGTTGQN